MEYNNNNVTTQIIQSVSKIVVGKDYLKEMLLIALLSQGHVLIEGQVGTGKTILARTFSQAIGGKFTRIQGTPDLMPSDILGFNLYRPDGTLSFIPGPIFTNILMVDEINRIGPRTQAALIEATAEGQVTIEGKTYSLKQPFVVIANQIPFGAAGTSTLIEVQLDRFMFKVTSGYPSLEEENRILEHINFISKANASPVTSPEEILNLQKTVEEIYVSPNIHHYILSIIDRLRSYPNLTFTPSPRGGISLLKGARAVAFLEGRQYVIPDDVKKVIIPALSHRVKNSADYELDGATPEAIIEQVSKEIPVPKVEA